LSGLIRHVTAADAEAIAEIYNWYITNTTITFEEEPVTGDDMAARFARVSEENPWLVLLEDGKLIGYAYAIDWKARSAYRFSKETTVYLHPKYYGGGRGTRLMQALIDEIRKTPIHVLIAGVALPNEASVALHEKLGFRKMGQFEEVGSKFGDKVDVGYWQLIL
jgi:phosphinothricin acetyltransferase|tara:strand:- start:462 stop:953 length:492 start_codon:yes stop_codon:yes gene_type:complete